MAGDTLPDPLPTEPMGLLVAWLEDASARATQPNPNAMTLATVDAQGRPAARVVLCRQIQPEAGYLSFYTNYLSRKGEELSAQPRAALVMHWDLLDRQVRVEGPVVRAPEADSDAYFATRHPGSRVAAWASQQSRPLAQRQDLLSAYDREQQRLGVRPQADGSLPRDAAIPRPPHWGGFRVFADTVELWLGHPTRLHDRAVWTRTLTPATIDAGPGFAGGPWSVTRLQP
jgi:pyridoxamine 5'-phosphate oxidase